MKSLIIAALLGFSGAAFGAGEVSCKEGSCLDFGWVIADFASGRTIETECEGDCRVDGWVTLDRGQVVMGSECMEESCFGRGWVSYDPMSRRMFHDVRCLRPEGEDEADCLRAGWVTRDFINGARYRASCVAGDCRQLGWDVQLLPNGPIQTVRCKTGGCFEEGWVVKP